MTASGIASTSRATAEQAMSIVRLSALLQPLQRHVVDVDDRDAVEVLEPRAQRDELEEVGHHLDVHALAARASSITCTIFPCSSSGSAT